MSHINELYNKWCKKREKIYLHFMQFHLKPDVFWWSFVMWQIGRIQHHFLKWDLKAPDINYMLNINSCLYSRYLGFIFILTHLFIVSLSLPYKLNQWRTVVTKAQRRNTYQLIPIWNQRVTYNCVIHWT